MKEKSRINYPRMAAWASMGAWIFFSLYVAFKETGLRKDWEDIFRSVGGSALVLISPAVAVLLGLRWCRFLVSLVALWFLPMWLIVPMVLHAVERTAFFWICWLAMSGLLFFSAVASWIGWKKVR